MTSNAASTTATAATDTGPVPVRDAGRDRPEPLWRHLVGGRLREERHTRGERLTDVAERAGVSPQYLSEVERGRKEPSSEMVAAISSALDLTLLDLTRSVAEQLGAVGEVRALGPAHPAAPAAPLACAAFLLAA
ncbi:MAG: helix-turn-helix domain-containing protein [Actinomycetaceae bacterium]